MRLGSFAAAPVVVLALGVAILNGAQSPDRAKKPAGKWVFVAAVENATGDATNDEWLPLALTRELSDSPYLRVASQDRINDALAVLHKPANTPLDLAGAKELCQVDTGIQVLISGRVEKTNSGFAVSIELTNPLNGQSMVNVGTQVGATLPRAIHAAALAIRKALGESTASIAPSRERVIHTPAGRPLDLYNQFLKESNLLPANFALRERKARAVVEADPAFAYGFWQLARIVGNPRPDIDQQKLILKRAVELKDTATLLERNVIDCWWHMLAGRSTTATGERGKEFQLALTSCEAALEIEPAHAVLSAVPTIVSQLGRRFDRSRYDTKLADIRPLSFAANAHEAQGRMWRGDVAGAVPYARAAAKAGHDGATAMSVAWVRLFPAYRAWADGDVKAASSAVETAWTSSNDLAKLERVALGHQATLMLATLGRLDRAAEIAAAMPNDQSFQWLEANATVLELRGETDKLRALLLPFLGTQPMNPGIRFLVPAGMVEEARTIIGRPQGPRDPFVPIQLWCKVGSWADVAAAGQPFLDPNRQKSFDTSGFLMAEMIARGLVGIGNTPQAIKLLVDYSVPRSAAAYDGYAWMQMRLQLAALYRQDPHRTSEAVRVEDELRKLLAVADDDFPLRLALKKQSGK